MQFWVSLFAILAPFASLFEVLLKEIQESPPNMTGRPGHRTMEMNGGSSAPYLARTPCVPLFSTLFNKGGNRRAFRLPGAVGGSFPLYGGTFARSYSVSKEEIATFEGGGGCEGAKIVCAFANMFPRSICSGQKIVIFPGYEQI